YEALRGVRRADPPEGWAETLQALRQGADDPLRQLLERLAVVFGDGQAVEQLLEIAGNTGMDFIARTQAIRSLVDAGTPAARPLLTSLLNDRDVAAEAVRGLARMG